MTERQFSAAAVIAACAAVIAVGAALAEVNRLQAAIEDAQMQLRWMERRIEQLAVRECR